MKTTHIIALILIAISFGVVVSAIGNSSRYGTFTEASKNEGELFDVVGKLNRDKPYEYNPEVNPNLFSFYLFDNDTVERKVILNKAMPQDFDRSEQIVIKGKMKGEQFIASDVLLKCPSKYNSEKPMAVQ